MSKDPKISGGDETVYCRFTEDGIEVGTQSPDEKRQFFMPWPWIELMKKEVVKHILNEKSIVEKPQAQQGLKGYSQF